jgi:RND family efflux transporter MFP subunit
MDLSKVIARTHISQSAAAELALGNEARLIGPGNVPIPAKVIQISPALDAANTTVEVWVEADNRDGKLRPGATVRVEIVARSVPNALIIPQGAVLASPSGATFAIVIDKDNKPHRRQISVGIRDGGSAQITEGLESGQRVATTGAFELFKLEDEILSKTKVQIAPAKEEEEPEET